VGCRNACGMRFDASNFIRPEALQTCKSIGSTPAQQFVKPWKLVITGGHNQFSANFMGNLMGSAKGDHLPNTRNGEPGFERAWLVIQPAVKHPRIVGALMPSDITLFFQDSDFGCWKALQDFERRGQTNYTCTDDKAGVHGQDWAKSAWEFIR
jgi:hypothetical protein